MRISDVDCIQKAFQCGSWGSVAAGIHHLAGSAGTFFKHVFIGAWDTTIRNTFEELFEIKKSVKKSTVSLEMSPILRDFLLDLS